MDEERMKRARELGRQLDAAEAERVKITSEIDGRIRRLTAEYAALFGEAGHSGATESPRAASEGRANGGRKTNGDKILAYLRGNPGADNALLVVQMYDEDTRENRNKLRGLMWFLKKDKKVKRIPGKEARWEVA